MDLYLARCPECKQNVAAFVVKATSRADQSQILGEWILDGLEIERSDSAVNLNRHTPGCTIGEKDIEQSAWRDTP
jgi:hypothetical protein